MHVYSVVVKYYKAMLTFGHIPAAVGYVILPVD